MTDEQRAECVEESRLDHALQDQRFVYVQRPRCPQCGSTKQTTTRSVDNFDGTRTQNKRCRCGHAFSLIWY